MWLFLGLSLLGIASSFQSTIKEGVVIRGSTAPLPDFDPLGFSENKDMAYLREAELKHGRWAMVGSLAVPAMEQMTHRAGIFEFSALPVNTQLCFLTAVAAYEFQFMLNGWKNPYTNSFELQDNYQPGDAGFRLQDLTDEASATLMDKELNNGRLAMIGFLGIMAQELVTQKPLF